MSNEFLAAIVAMNVVATISLWRIASRTKSDRPKLKKEASKALWESEPMKLNHHPPNEAGGNFAALATDVDQQFFADFRDFADVVNWWLADEFTASRFRLQDLPEGDLRLNVDFSSGPILGRAFAIFYNQTNVGRLEISPMHDYATPNPQVSTSIEIDWARFFGFDELVQFVGAVAMHVTRSDADRLNNYPSIQTAMTKTLWENYRISQYQQNEADDWGELNVGFQGEARFYLDRRDAPARKQLKRRA